MNFRVVEPTSSLLLMMIRAFWILHHIEIGLGVHIYQNHIWRLRDRLSSEFYDMEWLVK
jgi:hypothetical protein